jgi:predicted AlkP superfamily pyrophosphatase or phosphodiesterase
MRRHRCGVAGSVVLLALALAWPSPVPADPAQKAGTMRLAVLVVFDQMRGDYLTRWDELFGDDGFHRLEKDGAWFQNCHYPYAMTVTGAGHSSLATGTSAYKHGIVANEWHDRAEGESVYCATGKRYQRVPPAEKMDRKEDKKQKERDAGSPERLLSPTLGDALKEATGGKARIVALSLKDRSAVLPGGRRPDACYWLDTADGTIVTSTYYRDRVHPWVEEFNRHKGVDRFNRRMGVDRYFGRAWTRLRTDLDYARYSGPDDAPGEGTGYGQGVTFPHAMDGGLKKPGKKYYDALYQSPFGNELLLDLVRRAIDAEQLGSRDTPDLLTISFSCNDPIGHCWGPDSQEVLDVTLRADRIVKELLAVLDAKVGKGRYVLTLAADHGVCPLPEASRARGREAERLEPTLMRKQAEDFLQETFGKKDEAKTRWIEAFVNQNFYLDRAALKAAKVDAARVEKELARWAKDRPGIQAAYTRTQLLKGVDAKDEVGQRVRRSFHPERSGDVLLVLKPYYLMTTWLTGTMHGTPHPYDTHVPLLAYGPGIRGGVRKDAVTPQAGVAILAHALGIKPPRDAEAPVPEKLFADQE